MELKYSLISTVFAGLHVGLSSANMHSRRAAAPINNLTLSSPASNITYATTIPAHSIKGLATTASYKLVTTYDHTNFFQDFTFYTGADPTHGFVDYLDYADASAAGLATIVKDQIYMGVDYTTAPVSASAGRKSVRVTSNAAYTHGLFILDLAHMPGSICGVWPAYWMFGPNWPASGEIDIIEGVDTNVNDTISLHTSAGCTINIDGSQSGAALGSANCNQDSGNTGCSASTTLGQSYGDAFNLAGGGVYAMQWESSGLYVWFWPHDDVPGDVKAGAPVTTNWGLPVVAFNGGAGCTIDDHFVNMNIIFDTTFCGDWAGQASTWASSGCSALASTCTAYVQNYAGAFAPAYWLINTLKYYKLS